MPSLWIIADYLRELLPLLVPWGFLGYALFPFNLYIQLADITGIYGITFIIIVINSLLVFIIKKINLQRLKSSLKKELFNNRIPLVILLSMLILPISYGVFKTSHYQKIIKRQLEEGRGIDAKLIQGNFGLKNRWSGSSFYTRLHTYLGLTKDESANLNKKSIFLWPETVLNTSGLIDDKLFSLIISHMNEDSLLIAGGVRKCEKSKGVHNTAYIISGIGKVKYYDKNILLPYSETSPFGNILGGFHKAPSEFLKGETPAAVKTGYGTLGLSICFETLYPRYIRESVKSGATLLVNISNDAWFGNTAEPVLHLNSACLRAIENRRFLLRASNSGISAIVSPTGEIIKRTGLFTRESINGKILLLDDETLYSRFGDWALYLALFLVLISLIIAVRGRNKRGTELL